MAQAPSAEVIIVYGPSQAGKSTAVKKLLLPGCAPPAVGDGAGESVTEMPAVYKTVLGSMLDCPGCNDSLLRFTNEEVGKRAADAIAGLRAQQVKILIFESLANDSLHLRNTLLAAKSAFGDQALRGMVVVASKSNTCSSKHLDKKLDKIREAMEPFGLRNLVEWGVDEDVAHVEQTQDFKCLQEKLGKTPPVKFDALEDLSTRQRKRAEELCRDQVPQQTEETYVENEEYIENVERVEEYDSVEQRLVLEKEKDSWWKGGWFGAKKDVARERPVKVKKQHMVERPEKKIRKVEKKRTRKHFLPVEQFMSQALDELRQEDRQVVRSKATSLTPSYPQPQLLRLASVACEAVYEGKTTQEVKKYLEKISYQQMFSEVSIKNSGDTWWGEFSAQDLNTLFVAFRGTKLGAASLDDVQTSIKDLLADANISKTGNHAFDKVHAGFRSRAENVPWESQRYFEERIKGGKRVVLTGHSLGAATAGCLAYEMLGHLRQLSEQNPACLQRFQYIGFGSPMFLSENARFRISSNKWADRFLFVVNTTQGADTIASLPMKSLPMGFGDWEPVGTYLFLQRASSGTVKVEPLETEGRNDVNIVKERLQSNPNFEAHAIIGYRTCCDDHFYSQRKAPVSKL